MLERIKQFCWAEQINTTKFCAMVDWVPATLSNWNKGVRSDKLAKVAIVFPKLNMRWLLTGEGNMYQVDDPVDSKKEVWYKDQISKKDEVIETLSKQLDLLSKFLEKGAVQEKNISQSIKL